MSSPGKLRHPANKQKRRDMIEAFRPNVTNWQYPGKSWSRGVSSAEDYSPGKPRRSINDTNFGLIRTFSGKSGLVATSNEGPALGQTRIEIRGGCWGSTGSLDGC